MWNFKSVEDQKFIVDLGLEEGVKLEDMERG